MPSPTSWFSSYQKGSLWVTLDNGHQLYLLFISTRLIGWLCFRNCAQVYISWYNPVSLSRKIEHHPYGCSQINPSCFYLVVVLFGGIECITFKENVFDCAEHLDLVIVCVCVYVCLCMHIVDML